jgi:hypothetical protein
VTSIAQLSDVRAEGALLTPSGTNGAPEDTQIQAALESGQREMLKRFKTDEYNAARDYAGLDAEELEKQDRFKHAESCFALAHLPRLLTNVQLVKTGFVKTKKTGQSEQTFASGEETKKISEDWTAAAYEWLSKYLANKVLDSDANEIGFRTKDRRLTFSAI